VEAEQSGANRVLVTSGPTRAYFDRIRYIANTSTGALGARIVEAVASAGFPVTHLYGIDSERPNVDRPGSIESIEAVTVDDVISTVRTVCGRGDVGAVVHAMAVLDYVPERRLDEKKKSGDVFWDIRLVRSPKVIEILRDLLPEAFIVGFKLEAGCDDDVLVDRATSLLERHGLGAVVANTLERVSPGRHEALIVGPDRRILCRPETKESIAEAITGLIGGHVAGRRTG